MKIVESSITVNSELLMKCPDIEESVIQDLLMSIVRGMRSENLIEISKTQSNENEPPHIDETRFHGELFVMSRKEKEEIIEALFSLKRKSPKDLQHEFIKLLVLLTK